MCDGLRNVVRDEINHNLLPGLHALHGGWRILSERQCNAPTGARERHRQCADDQAQRCDNFKEDERLQSHASDVAQLAVPGDACRDGGKDERRYDHANQAQEKFAQEVRLCSEMR